MRKGTLYLIPVSLGPSPSSLTTPTDVATRARSLNYFVVENAKTARAELKRLEHPAPLRDLDIRNYPKSLAQQTWTDCLPPCSPASMPD
jgi:16S rRNA (cytidine1402-2'-O)-methyltransferase